MSDEAMIRNWKNIATRDGAAAFHPAGEIRLGQRGGPGQRAGLLAGLVGPVTYEGAMETSVSAMTVTSVTVA
ncbi:hypothetical protein C7C46_20240 [Streptomyces tateyamensis]|uniref:Uncharacterized protein n=1 Tax=Streptomyces tateyamensis TaxID=565073 RepID=A0A2V4NME2_9ACTN|nr:hypothetical protein [Streptomyces tateyamensis]PYC77064.1 hypothetical protein C7C46_20240 [Streptomyces tateyamensis]